MKRSFKTILAMLLACIMIVPCALSAFAADDPALAPTSENVKADHGFVEGDVHFNKTIAEKLEDIKVEVNGKPAYWNIGYLGYAHCQLRDNNNITKSSLQLGIVGADLTKDDQNKLKLTMPNGEVYEKTFTSQYAAWGTKYAKVTADTKAKTVTAEIIFNTDPKLAKGTTVVGETHDECKKGRSDRDNQGQFVVDDIKTTDAGDKLYIFKAENYVTTYSLLEFTYTDANDNATCFSATINSSTVFAPKNGTKVTLSDAEVVTTGTTDKFDKDKDRKVLFDGDLSKKIEGNFPEAGVTITFKADTAAGAPKYIAFGTHDDKDYPGRAPKAFTVYGSDSATEKGVKVFETTDAKISAVSEMYFIFNLNATKAYAYYTIEITANKGNGGYFQISEIAMFTGDVTYDALADGVEYNGTAYTITPPTTGGEGTGTGGEGTGTGGEGTGTGGQGPAETGDASLAIIVLALVSTLGLAVVATKRRANR